MISKILIKAAVIAPLLFVISVIATAEVTDRAKERIATGVVIPNRSVTLSSKITGRIMLVAGDEGQKVGRGDTLIAIDDSELQAELDYANVSLALAKLELVHRRSESERIARLYNMKTVPQSQLDNVKYDYDTAGQKLKLGEANIAKVLALLKETRLIAPFDAFIVSRQAEIGQLTHPGDGLLVLEDHSQLRFRTEVKERDIPHIAIGQLVYVTIDALDDLRLECWVSKIIPSGSTNHTFIVETTLPRHDKLYPGMFGKANFTKTMSFAKSRLPSIAPDGPASVE